MTVWRGWYGRNVLWLTALLVAVPASLWAAENAASEARMRKDIFFLASDECEGRGVTTKGINLAADYIAAEFQKAGLKPGGPDGSYFQPFIIYGTARPSSPNAVVLTGPQGQQIELTAGQQFEPLGCSKTGTVEAPLVFAGYGVTAKDQGYDDFQGLDLTGKVVVLLRKTPRPDHKEAPFAGEATGEHAALATKVVLAEQHHVAGIIFVSDASTAKDGDKLMTFNYSARAAQGGSIPGVHLRRAVLDSIVQSSLGTSLADLEQGIDRRLKPHSVPLTGWSVRMQVTVDRPTIPAKNVVGVLEGQGPHAQETIVIGAHYDHLGRGEFGSLARPAAKEIHHGADDNGSGTTAIMELARRLAQCSKRERRLVFIAFSGEERGLLGSQYYCKHPLFPLADTIAMVNLDMVGRLRADDAGKDKLQVHGTGTAKNFDALIDELNDSFGFKLQKTATGFGPSDHASFYARNIPVLFFFTGDHPDYHRPSDTADKINIPGMRRVTDLAEQVVLRLQSNPERPQFVRVRGSARIRTGTGPNAGPRIPRLGIRPSYDENETDGVVLEGVSDGGAAAKAGLKEGDRIVEIGGKPVKNLQAYMVVMGQHKPGEAIEVTYVRDGKKTTVKVKPE